MQQKIFYNASIHTMDKNNSTYQAMCIKDGKVSALGTNEQVLYYKNEDTQLIDLNGKVVIPGLIESHAHLFWVALSELKGELYIPLSIKDMLEYIKNKVKTLDKGEWIYFKNTYPTRLKEYRFPTLVELDEVSPDNPVYVDGFYAGQANSYALKLIGIDRNTPQPEHGRIIKDKTTGEPTGLLFRCGELITSHMKNYSYSVQDMKDGIVNVQTEYNKYGITSVIEGMSDFNGITAVKELYKEHKLNLRTVFTIIIDKEHGMEKVNKIINELDVPKEWAKLGFCKVTLDGGILTGTSYMRDPYKDDIGVFGIDVPDFRGIINFNSDQLQDYIDIAYKSDLQMTAHCIGDAAEDILIDAYEKYQKDHDIRDRRFSLIHCDFTDEETLNRIKDLNLLMLFQPAWHYMDAAVLRKVLTERTIKSFLPYRLFVDKGIHCASGSDHMVKYDSYLSQNPFNPFLALYNMVTRKTREGIAVGPEYRISRDEALRMYTSGGAYASFDENLKGSLEKGKAADFAVLSADYFNCPEENIKTLKSTMTVVSGNIVYKE